VNKSTIERIVTSATQPPFFIAHPPEFQISMAEAPPISGDRNPLPTGGTIGDLDMGVKEEVTEEKCPFDKLRTFG